MWGPIGFSLILSMDMLLCTHLVLRSQNDIDIIRWWFCMSILLSLAHKKVARCLSIRTASPLKSDRNCEGTSRWYINNWMRSVRIISSLSKSLCDELLNCAVRRDNSHYPWSYLKSARNWHFRQGAGPFKSILGFPLKKSIYEGKIYRCFQLLSSGIRVAWLSQK
jgi:hypothetical protein